MDLDDLPRLLIKKLESNCQKIEKMTLEMSMTLIQIQMDRNRKMTSQTISNPYPSNLTPLLWQKVSSGRALTGGGCV